MARQGFVVYYKDFDDVDEGLSDEDFRALFRALRQYSESGEIVALNGSTAMAFNFMRRADDCDRQRYEKRVASGKKAIGSRWDHPIPTDTNVYDRIPSNESYTSDSIPKPIPILKPIPNTKEDTGVTVPADAVTPPAKSQTKQSRFKKPTRDEVATYCGERGSVVDPVRWYDHYQANGWMCGRTPMKDWKAAVRQWERNGINTLPSQKNASQTLTNAQGFKSNPALEYTQRKYDDDEFQDDYFRQEAKRILDEKKTGGIEV